MLEQGGRQISAKLDHTLAKGCANLCNEIGKKMMVIQKDGKNLIGVLGSVDHFGNLFLYEASERICVGSPNGKYGDVPVGAILVRGDSLALTCEIDADLEQKVPLKKVPAEEILQIQQGENKLRAEKEEKIMAGLKERGMKHKHSTKEAAFGDDI